jgi:hypothetical protein
LLGGALRFRFQRLFNLAIDNDILVAEMSMLGWMGVCGDGVKGCLLGRRRRGVVGSWCSAPEFRGGSWVSCRSPSVLHHIGGYGCFWFQSPPPPPLPWWLVLLFVLVFVDLFTVMFVVFCFVLVCSQRSGG